MGRFYEGDGEFAWAWQGRLDSALAGKKTHANLIEFAAHLDAMPVKSLLYGRFADVKTGEACTVGEFCKMKGMDEADLAKYDKWDEEEGTAAAGKAVGLPFVIVWQLGFHNDELGARHVEAEGPTQPDWALYPRSVQWGKYEHKKTYVRVPLTGEERWRKVREYVKTLIDEGERLIAVRQRKKAEKLVLLESASDGR